MIATKTKLELFVTVLVIGTVLSLLLLTEISGSEPVHAMELPLWPQKCALQDSEHLRGTMFEFLSEERERRNREAVEVLHAVDHSRALYQQELCRFGSDISGCCVVD